MKFVKRTAQAFASIVVLSLLLSGSVFAYSTRLSHISSLASPSPLDDDKSSSTTTEHEDKSSTATSTEREDKSSTTITTTEHEDKSSTATSTEREDKSSTTITTTEHEDKSCRRTVFSWVAEGDLRRGEGQPGFIALAGLRRDIDEPTELHSLAHL